MPAGKTAVERPDGQQLPEVDATYVIDALARVKDPMMRYFLWLFIDLVTERIAQLDGMSLSARSRSEAFEREQ